MCLRPLGTITGRTVGDRGGRAVRGRHSRVGLQMRCKGSFKASEPAPRVVGFGSFPLVESQSEVLDADAPAHVAVV